MLTEDHLVEDAVMWEFVSHAADGSIQVKAAKEIKCYWPLTIGIALNSEQANRTKSANIFVDRLVPLRSVLRKGKKCDLPEAPDELVEVTSCNSVPDVKGQDTVFTVNVKRFGDTLPTIV